uniref:ABC transmembrane type-1 domain-containing protein n=1 Tax=Paramormyrops kingsleyae TaxID=1676925 RepID=A0A3B3S3W5_9TELE
MKLREVDFSGKKREPFRFAKPLEIILMIVGLLCAAANGVAVLLMCVVFGQMTDSFVQSSRPLNLTGGNFWGPACSLYSDNCPTIRAYYFVGIGVAVLILGTFQVMLFLLAATRQTKRIRERYFHSVIHQQMGWFDIHQIGVLITRLTE